MPEHKITFDPPVDYEYVYQRSTDDGVTWTPCDPPSGFPTIEEIMRAHEWPEP